MVRQVKCRHVMKILRLKGEESVQTLKTGFAESKHNVRGFKTNIDEGYF